jgi:transcriptional regulator NrdR family protein
MKCPKCNSLTTVLETRELYADTVNRRKRVCTTCAYKYNTYEIGDGLWRTMQKLIPAHADAIERKRILRQRNESICKRLLTGEKHASVANDYGLSDNMVSHIAKQMGVPSRRAGLLRESMVNNSKRRTVRKDKGKLKK